MASTFKRADQLGRTGARIAPALSVVTGSLVTIVPFIAVVPIFPPAGLSMLLAWRLTRPGVFRPWMPVPLGLLDDLVSGQPFGGAIFLWTMCFLTIDLIDQRVLLRGWRQDWMIAAGATAAFLLIERFAAAPFDSQVETALLLQIVAAALFYPVAVRLVLWLDRRRGTRT